MVEAERDSRSQQLLANFQVGAGPPFCRITKTDVSLTSFRSICHIAELRFGPPRNGRRGPSARDDAAA